MRSWLDWWNRWLRRVAREPTPSDDLDAFLEASVPPPQPIPVAISDEELKHIVRRWVEALARLQYAEAVAMTWPVVLEQNGSVSRKKQKVWTPRLLEAVVNNYGVPEPLEGETHKYAVAPLDARVREAFEAHLRVDREPFSEFGQHYLGAIHVDLPLVYPTGAELSDLTARLFLRPVSKDAMVLVLLDIHVM
jgi:hypothetical protein